MLDNKSHETAYKWFKRAQKNDDPFGKFDDLFKSLNGMYALNSCIDYENGKMARFCFNNIDIFKKFNAFDSEQIKIINDKPIINLKNNKPCLGLHKKIKEENMCSLFDLFYVVRCNLFHGSKSPDDQRDEQIVEACALLLEGFLRVYFDYVENELKRSATTKVEI